MDEIQDIRRRTRIVALLMGIAFLALITVISIIYMENTVRRWLYVIISAATVSSVSFSLYMEFFERKLIKHDQCQVIDNSRSSLNILFVMSLIITIFIIFSPLFGIDSLNIYGLSSLAIILPLIRASRNRIIIGEEYVLVRDQIIKKSEIIDYRTEQNYNSVVILCKGGRKFSVFMNPEQIARLIHLVTGTT